VTKCIHYTNITFVIPHCLQVQFVSVAYPGILFGGGGEVQQIQLRTEDRENGDHGAVAS